jgi:hypothetical protein
VYVLENHDTKIPVEAGISEFCLTLTTTYITGANQTRVNPVAMVRDDGELQFKLRSRRANPLRSPALAMFLADLADPGA